jgi:hypothetical protein
MTLRPGETPGHAIAIFPFLKTREPVRLGNFDFRSTDDTKGLSEEDSASVRETAEMLFLQDDLRIRTAVYAMMPSLDLDNDEQCLRDLEHIQAIVAYCYSAPRQAFGDLFFHFEHASLAVFSPEPVSIFLVRPAHHVEPLNKNFSLAPDQWHRVPGYQGRYDFRHPFYVAKGSRLYPPVPHIALNISQDLAADLLGYFAEAPKYRLLPELLRLPMTATAERVLTAITWYNRANALSNDDASSLLDLAVGFETLLALPKDAKTDRFIDAISLLLGRVPRLDLWAGQFYGVRCEVAHEGNTQRLRFMPTGQTKQGSGILYQSLLTYGRQIFQLCVGTLLFGDQLAKHAGLPDILVTNQERFESICKILDDDSSPVPDRFAAIDATVALMSDFRYVQETGLRIDTTIGAMQRAAKRLLLHCSASRTASRVHGDHAVHPEAGIEPLKVQVYGGLVAGKYVRPVLVQRILRLLPLLLRLGLGDLLCEIVGAKRRDGGCVPRLHGIEAREVGGDRGRVPDGRLFLTRRIASFAPRSALFKATMVSRCAS